MDSARNIVLHVILVVATTVALWLYPEIKYKVHRAQGEVRLDEFGANALSRIALLGLLLYEAFLFLRRAFAGRRVAAVAHLLCSALISLPLYLGAALHTTLQVAKVELLSSRYRACAEQAVEYSAGKRFSICDLRNRGEYYEAIVFDSEGEVTKDRNRRSADFRNYSGQPYIVENCDLDVTVLGRHLYLTGSSC